MNESRIIKRLASMLAATVIVASCGSTEHSVTKEAVLAQGEQAPSVTSAEAMEPFSPGDVEPRPSRGLSLESFPVPVEEALQSAESIFEGTVLNLRVDPYGTDYKDTFALGRRLAVVRVEHVHRGNVVAGSDELVWIGTEVKEGVPVDGDTNIVPQPRAGGKYLVLGRRFMLGETEASLGYDLFLPVEFSGLAEITDDGIRFPDETTIERSDLARVSDG